MTINIDLLLNKQRVIMKWFTIILIPQFESETIFLLNSLNTQTTYFVYKGLKEIHTLPVSEFWPARLLGTVGKIVVFTAKRVGKVQCFIFYSTSNLPISFKFLQIITYYGRKIMCEFH